MKLLFFIVILLSLSLAFQFSLKRKTKTSKVKNIKKATKAGNGNETDPIKKDKPKDKRLKTVNSCKSQNDCKDYEVKDLSFNSEKVKVLYKSQEDIPKKILARANIPFPKLYSVNSRKGDDPLILTDKENFSDNFENFFQTILKEAKIVNDKETAIKYFTQNGYKLRFYNLLDEHTEVEKKIENLEVAKMRTLFGEDNFQHYSFRINEILNPVEEGTKAQDYQFPDYKNIESYRINDGSAIQNEINKKIQEFKIKSVELFNKFVLFVKDLQGHLNNPDKMLLFFHCKSGKDRTGMIHAMLYQYFNNRDVSLYKMVYINSRYNLEPDMLDLHKLKAAMFYNLFDASNKGDYPKILEDDEIKEKISESFKYTRIQPKFRIYKLEAPNKIPPFLTSLDEGSSTK